MSPRWDPLPRHRVGQPVRQVAVAVGLGAYLASLVAALTAPDAYPVGYAVGVLVVSGLALAYGVREWRRPAGPLRAARALVLLGLAQRVAETFLVTVAPGSPALPLFYLQMTAMLMTGVAFVPRVGLPLVAAYAVTIGVERARGVGVAGSLVEVTTDVSGALLIFFLTRGVDEGLDQVRSASMARFESQARARRAAHKARVRRELDALVHDKILAALKFAAHGEGASAGGLARDALAMLTVDAGADAGTDAGDPDGADAVRAHADAQGVPLTWSVEGWPEGAAGEALRGAACEALTNVALHARAPGARATGGRRGDLFHLEIADDGRGFDPASVARSRLGIRSSIRDALESVDGQAEIISRPGAGTRVVMAVPFGGVAAPDVPMDWQHLWRLIAPVLAVHMAGFLAAGALHLGASRVLWLAAALMIALPLVTALLTVVPRGAAVTAVMVGTTAVWVLLFANLADPAIDSWQLWFNGACGIALGIVAVRRGAVQALAMVTVAYAAGIAWHLAGGASDVTPIVASLPQDILWPLAAAWVRRRVAQVSQTIHDQHRLRSEADSASVAAEVLQTEIATRWHILETEVRPTLADIAAGRPLGTALRQRCALLERTCRDNLVAGPLLTESLRGRIAAARARGCEVEINGRDGVTGSAVETFRRVAGAFLDAGEPGDHLSLLWAPNPDGTLGTALLSGAGAGAALAATAGIPGLGRRDLDDLALVEVRDQTEPTASGAP